MAGREREHAVLNVYGEPQIETVQSAIDQAKSNGAATDSEAVVDMASAYLSDHVMRGRLADKPPGLLPSARE